MKKEVKGEEKPQLLLLELEVLVYISCSVLDNSTD